MSSWVSSSGAVGYILLNPHLWRKFFSRTIASSCLLLDLVALKRRGCFFKTIFLGSINPCLVRLLDSWTLFFCLFVTLIWSRNLLTVFWFLTILARNFASRKIVEMAAVGRQIKINCIYVRQLLFHQNKCSCTKDLETKHFVVFKSRAEQHAGHIGDSLCRLNSIDIDIKQQLLRLTAILWSIFMLKLMTRSAFVLTLLAWVQLFFL